MSASLIERMEAALSWQDQDQPIRNFHDDIRSWIEEVSQMTENGSPQTVTRDILLTSPHGNETLFGVSHQFGWYPDADKSYLLPLRGNGSNEDTSDWAKLHPDGRRVIWSRKPNSDDFFGAMAVISNLDGTEYVELTDGQDFDASVFSWSRDGSRFACLRYFDDGSYELWAQDVDGGNPVRLLEFFWGGSPAAWSPDGETVAAQDYISDENYQTRAVLVATDGSGIVSVLSPDDGLDWAAIGWSPDGETILLVKNTNGPGGTGATEDTVAELYSVNPDGTNLQGPISIDVEGFQYISNAVYKPDGSRILLMLAPVQVFVPSTDQFEAETPVYSIALDGTDPIQIAPNTYSFDFGSVDPAYVNAPIGSFGDVWVKDSANPDGLAWSVEDGLETFGYRNLPDDEDVRIQTRVQSYIAATGGPYVAFKQRDDAGTLFTGKVSAMALDGSAFIGVAKPTITGSRGGNAALADLLTKLAALGIITDGSS